MGAFAPQVQPQEDVEDDEDFYGYPPSTNANGLPDTTAGAQEDGSVGRSARWPCLNTSQ